MSALPGRVCIPVSLSLRNSLILIVLATRLNSENISKDGNHCQSCVEITERANRKSLSKEKGSNLPPGSAKIRKLLELLEEIDGRKDEDGEPTGEKTIVFSQFTTMLNLIELFLKDAGISFARCKPFFFCCAYIDWSTFAEGDH
jgi:SNF2 family DNA or RNA helicase